MERFYKTRWSLESPLLFIRWPQTLLQSHAYNFSTKTPNEASKVSIEAQKDEKQISQNFITKFVIQKKLWPLLYSDFSHFNTKLRLSPLSPFCYPRPNAPFPILFPLSKVGQDTSAHEPMLPLHVPTKDLNHFSIHTPFYLLTALTIYFH